MAAAPGNQYAAKARKWTQAIERALVQRSLAEQREALDELAEVLINQALAGEQWALKELGDRLEGKPAQSVVLGGDADNPVVSKVIREIVDPATHPNG